MKSASALSCCLCLAGSLALVGLAPREAAARARRDSDTPPTGRITPPPNRYRDPDLHVDGFPVWLGNDGKADRLIILVEGFDALNMRDAEGLMRIVWPVANGILEQGLDILVVDFPDSHPAPDKLSPYLERAIRAGALASGQPVAVVGICSGGIVARWALVSAEERGEPLPVNTLMLLDTPNRGARFNPSLLALVTSVGGEKVRAGLMCPFARAVLTCLPSRVEWQRVGAPGMSRKVPKRCDADSSEHDAFFERLRKLNSRGGYPRACRVVGLALGSRQERPRPAGPQPDLFRLWLPFGGWVCRAEPEDTAPGSLLPSKMASRCTLRLPLGIAGAYLRTVPTFISTESALDAEPGEEPPFDEWYARPDDEPRIGHDEMRPKEVAFAVAVLRRSFGSEPGLPIDLEAR